MSLQRGMKKSSNEEEKEWVKQLPCKTSKIAQKRYKHQQTLAVVFGS